MTRSRARPTSGPSTRAGRGPGDIARALGYLDANGFCDPYPLRYETGRRPSTRSGSPATCCPTTRAARSGRASARCTSRCCGPSTRRWPRPRPARYVEWIERDGTFWEVMNSQGQNWVSPRWVLIGEESMLWSAIFLDLLEHPQRAGVAVAGSELRAVCAAGMPIPDRT